MKILPGANLALFVVTLVGLVCFFSHTLSLEISDGEEALDWWEDSFESEESKAEDNALDQANPVLERNEADGRNKEDNVDLIPSYQEEPEVLEDEMGNPKDQPIPFSESSEDDWNSIETDDWENDNKSIINPDNSSDLESGQLGEDLPVLGTMDSVFRNNSEGLSLIATDIMIESEPITNWGGWGPLSICPEGTYAAGFLLKTEADQGKGDDTSLNACKLICIPPGSNDFEGPNATEIASSESSWGVWGRKFYCDKGVITGFQLRTEKYQGKVEKSKRKIKKGLFGWTRSTDDTAANNLRVFCSNLGDKGFLEGDGHSWGHWTAPQKCLSQQAVCGIQSQNEEYQGDGDDTAVNNLKMKCCTLPNLGAKCDPSDKWETLLECDNSHSTEPLTCTYQKSRGVSRSSSSSEAMWHEFNTMLDLGFSSNLIYNGLNMNFRYNLSESEATGYEWKSESGETFSEVVTTMAEFTVPGGMKSRLSQAVGACGVFNVHTNFFKKEDCLPGTDIVVQESVFLDE